VTFSYPTCIWHLAGGDPVGMLWRCLMPVKVEWLATVWCKKTDNMLSSFHLIPERHGQTELLYQYRASAHWCAIKIISHLTKTKTSLVIWLNIVTIVARSVNLFAGTHAWRCPCHSAIALSMMVWLPFRRSWSCTTRASYQCSCMVRTAGRYLRWTHVRSFRHIMRMDDKADAKRILLAFPPAD